MKMPNQNFTVVIVSKKYKIQHFWGLYWIQILSGTFKLTKYWIQFHADSIVEEIYRTHVPLKHQRNILRLSTFVALFLSELFYKEPHPMKVHTILVLQKQVILVMFGLKWIDSVHVHFERLEVFTMFNQATFG